MADAPAPSADAPVPAAKRRGISFKNETEGWEDVLKEEAQLEQPAGADGATPQRQRQLKQAIDKVVKVQRTQSALKGGDGAGLKPVPLTGATWKEMQDAMAKDPEDTFGKHEHHDGIIQRGLKRAASTFFGVHREEEDDEDKPKPGYASVTVVKPCPWSRRGRLESLRCTDRLPSSHRSLASAIVPSIKGNL